MRLATGSTSLREVDVASPMRVSNDVVAMRCDGCEIFDGFLKFRAELFRQRWFCKEGDECWLCDLSNLLEEEDDDVAVPS
ncbi:hypothetical protein DEO72_LG11g2356 [Vigna unguiculata]|uniref:Uncharacterized protein n=1 Tax=Vigna unguiculata TaxID=3917 RepID=A0A4D6NP02_VIGUN|nr:hypothetical protein DEO72_LG11g2356 [Vigna unguiculata]